MLIERESSPHWRPLIKRTVESRHRPLDRIFAAVSDPTRRAILKKLSRRPSTVTEIASLFPVSLNAISKHIMVLERAGLLRRQIRGHWHICRLDARPLRKANTWFEEYRDFWESRLDNLATYVDKQHKAARKNAHTR